MASNATLKFNGKEYKDHVLSAKSESSKPVDSKNRASGLPTSGTSTFELKGGEDTNALLTDFYTHSKTFEAEFILREPNNDEKEIKKIEYKGCSIVNYKWEYNSESDEPYTITFTMVYESIKAPEGAEFKYHEAKS